MSRKFFFRHVMFLLYIDIYNRKGFFLYEKLFALDIFISTIPVFFLLFLLQLVVMGLGCSLSEASNCLSIEEKFGQFIHVYIFFLHMAIYKTFHST